VKNGVLICGQLSSVLLEAQSRAKIAGTVVAERQHVLASIIGATRDVGHPLRDRFGMLQLLLQASTFENAEAANYRRLPADTERILGLDRRGWVHVLIVPVILLDMAFLAFCLRSCSNKYVLLS
jgi:hypothetical protein